jgi:hypothetical protein
MKIEIKENFIFVTPEEGKVIYEKAKPQHLIYEIYMPKTFTEEKILAKYGEVSLTIFEELKEEPKEKIETADITKKRFSKLAIKYKLKELGIWDIVKASLTDDEYEDLLIADDFAFDNELFVKVYESLKLQIPNIDELLAACVKNPA